MCQLNERAQSPSQSLPLQTSEIGDTHVYQVCGSNTQIWTQWTIKFAQKSSKIRKVRYVHRTTLRHYCIINIVTLSGVNVSECVFM